MSEKYAEIKRILSNVRNIRTLVRELDYVFLIEAHEKLGMALNERKDDFDRECAEKAQKEDKKNELLALIASEGFTLDDLQGRGEVKKRQGNRRHVKYTYEENGEVKTWTGVGRKPKPIEAALAAGQSLDEFLIKVQP
ncbi:H-NS histone family protein (plasmid) [Yersinia massiliensis]|uniref:H-NS family histone-like protein n=1 Tax=Yersinia massiliensis TaxID=419257 RepID=UPI0015620907|nr:H-NS family nucleoid-associated regulatory protein [Yersinia massiliensis]QKJ09269.1 H-NS histone family protein [Yersinia massiliensis]